MTAADFPIGTEVRLADTPAPAGYGIVVGYDLPRIDMAGCYPVVMFPSGIGPLSPIPAWFAGGETVDNTGRAPAIGVGPAYLVRHRATANGEPCTCPTTSLMRDGCRCGAIVRTRP